MSGIENGKKRFYLCCQGLLQAPWSPRHVSVETNSINFQCRRGVREIYRASLQSCFSQLFYEAPHMLACVGFISPIGCSPCLGWEGIVMFICYAYCSISIIRCRKVLPNFSCAYKAQAMETLKTRPKSMVFCVKALHLLSVGPKAALLCSGNLTLA